MSTHINDLREQLMNTLADLRNRSNPMEPRPGARNRHRGRGAGGHGKGGGGLHPGNRPGHQQLYRLTQNAQGAGGNHERTHWQGGQEHAGGSAAHDGG